MLEQDPAAWRSPTEGPDPPVVSVGRQHRAMLDLGKHLCTEADLGHIHSSGDPSDLRCCISSPLSSVSRGAGNMQGKI